MPTSTTNTTPSFQLYPGTVNVDMGIAQTMTLQSDGKVVLGGYSVSSTGTRNDFSVVRLNVDGSLDTTFSGDGKAVIDVGGYSDVARSMVVQSDGKVVLAGYSWSNSSTDYDFSVVRLNVDGSLDTSFSGDGKAVIDLGRDDFTTSMVIQSDGKVVLGGYSSYSSGYTVYSVVRLNADGSLDSSFSGDGRAVIDVGVGDSDDFANSVVVQSDGKVVLGGYSGSNYSVVRLNADGSLDSSFSGDGKAVIDVGGTYYSDQANSMVVQSDGKVVLGGYSNGDYSVVRLNADGSLDSSFSGDGKAVIDVGGSSDVAYSMVVQSDGKLVLGGVSYSSDTNNDFSVVRLNTDGSLDTSFGGDGKTVIDLGGYSDQATSMMIQSDGKLVLGGNGGASGQGAVVRLNADGSLDTSFGAVTSLSGTVTYAENAAPVILDSSVQITDAELSALNSGAGNYAGASITLARAGGISTQDVFSGSGALSFSGGSAVLSGTTVGTVSNGSGTLTITFNSAATQAVVNSVLSAIAYSNTSDAPPANVQIGWTFSDGNSSNFQGSGGALSATGITIINITKVNDVHTGSVTITGTAQQGQTLTATNTLADADGLGSISYQWLRGGSVITGANGSSYTLVANDVGQSISMRAIYLDGGGTSEVVTSTATSAVQASNNAPSFHNMPRTGSVSVDVGQITDLTLQSEGEVVLLGYSVSSGDYDCSVVRLKADGSLDTSFSGDGKTVIDESGYSMVVQGDGKVVLGGAATAAAATTTTSAW